MSVGGKVAAASFRISLGEFRDVFATGRRRFSTPKYELGAILTIRRGPKLHNQTGMLSFDYHLFDARVYVSVCACINTQTIHTIVYDSYSNPTQLEIFCPLYSQILKPRQK